MSEKTPVRPSQATLAGWMIIIGSVVVVLTAFEVVGGLRTLETREAVEGFLAESPGSGLGLSVTSALELLRVAAMVAAACATAAAILGWFALRRDRSARLALSVLALPLFVSGAVTGGFMSALVTVAIVLLWTQPARDWFNGVTRPEPQPQPMPAPGPGRPSATEHGGEVGQAGPGGPATATLPLTGEVSAQGRAWDGFGTAPEPGASGQGRRPGAVVMACALTWIVGGLAALLALSSMVIVALEPTRWLREIREQNPQLADQDVSDDLLTGAIVGTGGLLALWSLAAVVLAVLVFRGVAWARIALIASAAAAAAFSLLGTLTSLALLVPLLACTLTISCLFRPETRAWFSREP